jgi:hypothetical protein
MTRNAQLLFPEMSQRQPVQGPIDAQLGFDDLKDKRFSEPMLIGKHEWRIRYEVSGTINYEWRRPPAQSWKHYRDWPTYDFNNGMTLGLPVGLKRLFAREAADVAAQKARRFVIVDINAHAGTVKLISPEGVTYDCLEGHSQSVIIRTPMALGSNRIVLDAASPIMAQLTLPTT